MNLHKTRTVFNLLIENYNIMDKNLGGNVSIIHSKVFERGRCKKISGKNGVKTAEEKLVVARFRKEIVVTSKKGAPPTLADRALLMAKNTKELNYEYQPMEWLNPTSNVVEKPFSRAKMVFSDHRMSLLALKIEESLFLYKNKRFWDTEVISKFVEQ